jgi:catechol 2,3-dioxygenase-like lactoylglutathione lyase family enzyme
MRFISSEVVVKISVSDVPKSIEFFDRILGFEVEDKYTLNNGGSFGVNSYVQMSLAGNQINGFALGLFNDIIGPFDPIPNVGTVPSFIVADVVLTLKEFMTKGVVVDKIGDKYILSNTSDEKYVDRFFFFRDPDNNSFVIRQNMGII